jgi:hypothetical protein
MASFKDLTEIQGQLDERVGVLREGFGVLEADFTKLQHEEDAFEFDLDKNCDNLLRHALTEQTDRLHKLYDEGRAKIEPTVQSFKDLTHAFDEETKGLSDHIDQHRDGHHALHQEMVAFSGEIDQAGSELEHAKEEFLGQVGQMAGELNELAEKVFATSGDLAHSIQETQTQVIQKASGAFKDLLGSHTDSLLPGHFEQTLSHLTHAVSDLGSQCNTVGTEFQHELETLLQHVGEHATHEVQSKVQEKFQKLIHEAVAFLAEQITESITATTAGAAITGAMSPILPELAALKVATEIIKDAIAALKALEDAIGL